MPDYFSFFCFFFSGEATAPAEPALTITVPVDTAATTAPAEPVPVENKPLSHILERVSASTSRTVPAEPVLPETATTSALTKVVNGTMADDELRRGWPHYSRGPEIDQ